MVANLPTPASLVEVTMIKNVRSILTAMVVLLMLGGTIALTAFAADPTDKNPNATTVAATPKADGITPQALAATPKPPAATPKPPAATPKPKATSTPDDKEATSTPAPTLPPALPPLSYSFIPNTTSSMFVDGFGPVLVMSVQLSTGQTFTIPAPPYSLSMIWGSFGTYANWAAQFQAQNGRAPTEQDQIDFWISQASAGQLRISPTP
jgi:hypothetical protein